MRHSVKERKEVYLYSAFIVATTIHVLHKLKDMCPYVPCENRKQINRGLERQRRKKVKDVVCVMLRSVVEAQR